VANSLDGGNFASESDGEGLRGLLAVGHDVQGPVGACL
jgi:hypothetical protein